jgi:hypothetical protein
VDVLGHHRQVVVALDDPGFEAALEEVAFPVVTAVEAHRIQAIQPLHPFGELGLRRLDQQMEVIVEQHPDVDPPAEAPLHVDEQLLPLGPVGVVQEQLPLLDAAADDVVVGWTR